MKKILSILSAALICFSMSSMVSAQSNEQKDTFNEIGATLNLPEEFYEKVGQIHTNYLPDIDKINKIGGVFFYYDPLTKEAFDEFWSREDIPEEELDAYVMAPLFGIISIGNGKDFSFLENDYGLDVALATELAKVEDYSFYYYDAPTISLPEGIDPIFINEYEEMREKGKEYLADAEFFVPKDADGNKKGNTLSFETTDLDGNPVKSEELFGQHEITMVNVWTSWCPPCKGELPELQAINGRLAADDCAVVGVLLDANDPGAIDDAKEILTQSGVTYPILMPSENMSVLVEISSVPTTFFVDRDGVILDKVIQGAYVQAYEPAIKELLMDKSSEASDASGS